MVAPSVNHSGMSAAVGDVFSHPRVTYERTIIPGAESLVAYSLKAPRRYAAKASGSLRLRVRIKLGFPFSSSFRLQSPNLKHQ